MCRLLQSVSLLLKVCAYACVCVCLCASAHVCVCYVLQLPNLYPDFCVWRTAHNVKTLHTQQNHLCDIFLTSEDRLILIHWLILNDVLSVRVRRSHVGWLSINNHSNRPISHISSQAVLPPECHSTSLLHTSSLFHLSSGGCSGFGHTLISKPSPGTARHIHILSVPP